MQQDPPRFDLERIVEQLEASALGRLERSTLEHLARAGSIQNISGGEFLIHEGDEGDELFVLLRGRMQVLRDDVLLEEVAPGTVIGEIAILCQVRRVASVRAIRDSCVLALSRFQVQENLSSMPGALLSLFELIGDRLVNRQPTRLPTPRVITVIACGSVDGSFISSFIKAVGLHGTVAVLRSSDKDAEVRLENLEQSCDYVLLISDKKVGPWERWCWRQADRIVLLVSVLETEMSLVERALYEDVASNIHARIVLGVLHNGTPQGVQAFLAERRPDVHINLCGPSCLPRLARCVLGKGVGLVLGGGAARGFAHVGVLRALFERGVPVDVVGGTSVGAATAAAVAMGQNIDRIESAARQLGNSSVLDLTLPFLSIATGKQLKKVLIETTGGGDIEDLILPFYALAADLVSREAIALGSGPTWKAVRASMSVPGVWSPIRRGEAVLVDGGVIDNLPIKHMSCIPEVGVVIAVKLDGDGAIQADKIPEEGVCNGWRLVLPSGRDSGPNIVSILFAMATLSRGHPAMADLTISPRMHGAGFFGFDSADRLLETGYRDGLAALDGQDKNFWFR